MIVDLLIYVATMACLSVLAVVVWVLYLYHKLVRKSPTGISVFSLSANPDANILKASPFELAKKIRTKQLTSQAVVGAFIKRAKETHSALNAIVADRFDDALREAAMVDHTIGNASDTHEFPPLYGVPCTVKEAFAVKGMPNTGGSRLRRNHRAPEDAPVVERLRRAGCIIVGVTNLSELCMWQEAYNPVYGRTNNPHDTSRTSGGSSGGEAAAIAAFASPCGIGSDIGGSLRMPAFFCGIFAHKPTSGLVPNREQFPCAATPLLVSGPMTRYARDLMPLLRIMAGPDPKDVREWTRAVSCVADDCVGAVIIATSTPDGAG
jgi:fatty acid amide hydrolase 2